MRGITNSLHSLSETRGEASDLDLSAMRSDLVSSAASVFSSGWSNAIGSLILASRRLANGADEAARDFIAAEQSHIDSLTASIDALEE